MYNVIRSDNLPANPTSGLIWVKTKTGEIRVYENGGWRLPTGREKEAVVASEPMPVANGGGTDSTPVGDEGSEESTDGQD